MTTTNAVSTETKLPGWLDGKNDHPEIWEATKEAQHQCYCSPTGWFKRGDHDALQFLGAKGEEPHSAETIRTLTKERVEFEKALVAAAKEICREWGGVSLLTPQQVRAEEHCVLDGYLVNPEVEPGYAQIRPVNGGYALKGAVWGPELQVTTKRSAVRTDNGPAISHGATEFFLPGGEKIAFHWMSGGFSPIQWGYRVLEGKIPSSPNPELPFKGVTVHNAPQPGSGHSSATTPPETVTIQLRVGLYRDIPGFKPKRD